MPNDITAKDAQKAFKIITRRLTPLRKKDVLDEIVTVNSFLDSAVEREQAKPQMIHLNRSADGPETA